MKNPEIVNVIATANMRQKVDLIQISQLRYTIHDTEIYGGRVAYLKTPEMHGKVTIFPSGKLISIGTRSSNQAQEDLEKTVKTLVDERLIEPIAVKAEIRNIVAVLNLERSLDLEGLSLATDGIYEPEQFPGLILRHDEPKVTFLIFNSGKVVIAGGRSIQELTQAAEQVKDIVNLGNSAFSHETIA